MRTVVVKTVVVMAELRLAEFPCDFIGQCSQVCR